MPNRALLAVLAGVTATSLAACTAGSGTSNQSGTAGAEQAITVGLTAKPASLDFTKADGAAIPQAMLTNVYQTLVTPDQSGTIVGQLAKSWTISPDRKTYTFTLVDNATFSNGEKFTAEDAVFSINRVKTDWTPAVKAAMDVVADAKAPDPTTLVVTLKQPSNDWLFRMSTRVGAMFARNGVADLATKPIGTGPYTVSSWTGGDSLELTSRQDYWGTKPYFNKVTLKYIGDATALNNAMLSGSINVLGNVQAPEALGQFTKDPSKYQVIEGTTNGEVVLSFNHAKPVFKDIRVRQAIRRSIDKKALLDTCFAGRGTLIGSMVPPTDPWYQDLTKVDAYNPTQAKALLAAAKQPNPTLRLRVPNLPYAVSCGQVVKSDLEKTGFKVTLDTLEFPAAWVTQVFTGGDYDMSIVGHVEPRDMPTVFGNPKYYLHYNNPAVQKLFATADSGSEADQKANLAKAAALISEDAAADWLFLLPNLMVAQPGITGLPKNALTESFDLTALGHS